MQEYSRCAISIDVLKLYKIRVNDIANGNTRQQKVSFLMAFKNF